MKCLIVKVKDRKRTPTYKKMISGKDIYSFPSNLDDAIEYSPSTLHEENEWYMITSFSKTKFCIEFLKEDFSSVNYEKLSRSWFCQYHLTHFIRTRIMQRERYDHSRAFFELPEAAHRWRCRFFCWPSNS